MEKVIAVVVTYNRPGLLAECIEALRQQTRPVDKILVINNGSTDHTESWLHRQKDLAYFTQDNTGSGGGFHTGIKLAYEQGFDWIWLMDDDGYPKEDALEKLLEGNPEPLMLRNCAVINKEDKKSFVWKTGHYASLDEVDQRIIMNVSHPFNGTLLHRKIVDRVGLPRPNLFIWGDETEYRFRIISKYKIPYCTIGDSIHYHPASAWAYKNDWNFASNWKMYYYLRNRYAILQSKFYQSRMLSALMYIGFILLFSGTVLAFQKTDKLKKLAFIFWPVAHAFSGNYAMTPAHILKKTSSPGYFSGSYLNHHLKMLKILLPPVTPELENLPR